MNLATILSQIGLHDGEGNVSSTRVIFMMIALSVIVPHVWVFFKTGAIVPFTNDELGLLGIMSGTKLVQNAQENKSTTTTTK